MKKLIVWPMIDDDLDGDVDGNGNHEGGDVVDDDVDDEIEGEGDANLENYIDGEVDGVAHDDGGEAYVEEARGIFQIGRIPEGMYELPRLNGRMNKTRSVFYFKFKIKIWFKGARKKHTQNKHLILSSISLVQ